MHKFGKVEKRGGMRRPVKRRPRTKKLTAFDYFKDGKGIFTKRLAQYRFVIYTDFEPEQVAALKIFSAWIKTNEKFFDSHNNFPIYAFVVGKAHDQRIKIQRAREYLKELATLLGWDDSDHHLYNGYISAGNRIWVEGDCDPTFVEQSLLENDITDDPDYPTPEFSFNDLKKVKPDNLFMIYLKPPEFENDELEFLLKIPGVACCSKFNMSNENIQRLLNRTNNDASLIVYDDKMTITKQTLFQELDLFEDEKLDKVIYTWNDHIFDKCVEELQGLPAFQDDPFDDYDTFDKNRKNLTIEQTVKYSSILETLTVLLQNNNRVLAASAPMALIAMLRGSGAMKNNFKFERLPELNTWTIQGDNLETFISSMLITSLNITNQTQ